MKFIYKGSLSLVDKYMKRHNALMIGAASIISLVALFFIVYWEYDTNDISPLIDNLYLGGNIFFCAISVILTGLLVLSRFVKLKVHFMAVVLHVYVFLLIVWGTLVCIMDLRYGLSPMFYLMIFTIIAGLFVVEPVFFIILLSASFTTVLIYAFQDRGAFFSGVYKVENIITFSIYMVVILLVAVQHIGVSANDYRIEKQLEYLTYCDDLTGLLNERSYLKTIEEVDNDTASGKLHEYAVILMDVNNLKATNDAYGHRYGCHLVVRCGKTIPQFFKTSKLFHVGGDEFVAIVYGDDYKRFDEIMKAYDENLSYSLVEFDGHELIFSVAFGYAKYEKGMKYKDVLQKADVAMYAHKKMLKEKYHMAKR